MKTSLSCDPFLGGPVMVIETLVYVIRKWLEGVSLVVWNHSSSLIALFAFEPIFSGCTSPNAHTCTDTLSGIVCLCMIARSVLLLAIYKTIELQASFLSYYVTQCFQHIYLATSTLWGEDGQSVFGSDSLEFTRGTTSFRYTHIY